MAETKYEVTYIIRPDLDDAAKTELVERFDNILKENGANIIDSKDWQKRKLAYEEVAKAINEFDRLGKINNDILRHMIVKRED